MLNYVINNLPYRRVEWNWYRKQGQERHTSDCRSYEQGNWQLGECTCWNQSENKNNILNSKHYCQIYGIIIYLHYVGQKSKDIYERKI